MLAHNADVFTLIRNTTKGRDQVGYVTSRDTNS